MKPGNTVKGIHLYHCSEHLIKQMADHLHSDGFLAAGYEYVAIDDCWPEKKRDKDGKLLPDHIRFPSGFKALGDYVSNKGPD